MTQEFGLRVLDCEAARSAIQERLDDALSRTDDGHLADHTAACESCREFEEGLGAVREGLQSLPLVPLPDEALEAVWAHAVEREEPRSVSLRWAPAWLAAAAVLTFAIVVPWSVSRRAADARMERELARATAETRLVLAVTSRALQRVEEVAVGEVLNARVSPALERLPIEWLKTTIPNLNRRPGT